MPAVHGLIVSSYGGRAINTFLSWINYASSALQNVDMVGEVVCDVLYVVFKAKTQLRAGVELTWFYGRNWAKQNPQVDLAGSEENGAENDEEIDEDRVSSNNSSISSSSSSSSSR